MDEVVKNRGYHLTCFLLYNIVSFLFLGYAAWITPGYWFMLISVIGASFSKYKAAGYLGIIGVIASLNIPITLFVYTSFRLPVAYQTFFSTMVILLYISMVVLSYRMYKLAKEKEEVKSEEVKSEEVKNVEVVRVESQSLFCASCGTKISESARFCFTCGHEISQLVSVLNQ